MHTDTAVVAGKTTRTFWLAFIAAISPFLASHSSALVATASVTASIRSSSLTFSPSLVSTFCLNSARRFRAASSACVRTAFSSSIVLAVCREWWNGGRHAGVGVDGAFNDQVKEAMSEGGLQYVSTVHAISEEARTTDNMLQQYYYNITRYTTVVVSFANTSNQESARPCERTRRHLAATVVLFRNAK